MHVLLLWPWAFIFFWSEPSQKLLMRAIYISANLAIMALPERYTTSYFAQKIVRFPQNSPGHYCPPDLPWLVHLWLFYKSSFMHDCLTILYIWIIVAFCVPLFLPLDFMNRIVFYFFYFSYCYFLFYFYVTLVFFSFVLVLIVIAFPTVIFSHIISCLPGEWALLTFVFKSLSSEKRIILVNERLEGSDGRRVGGKQQCFSGSYFKEKTLHYDWLRVGPRYWIYWIQFKWSFKIKYYCFKKQ